MSRRALGVIGAVVVLAVCGVGYWRLGESEGEGEGEGEGERCVGEACSAARGVPGATYQRLFDGAACAESGHDATVSAFTLDRYEVTVGRFRAFVASGGGTRTAPPAPEAGAHPRIESSGWRSEWDAALTADATDLGRRLDCGPSATWTAAAGADEALPINCLTWYEAFAFCAWDGGRLPTEAEWNLAAAGGDQQRERPWAVGPGAPIDRTRAVFGEATTFAVGSCSPRGDGRWGHADLVGNVWEWTLDANAGTGLLPRDGASPCATDGLPVPCVDCAALEGPAHVSRGGGFGMPSVAMRGAIRRADDPTSRFPVLGVRCARDGPAEVVETIADTIAETSGASPTETSMESALRAGAPLPSFVLRGFRPGAMASAQPLAIGEMLGGDRRVLLVFTSLWCDEARGIARDLVERRGSLVAQGIQPFLVIGDGEHHGQATDTLGVASFVDATHATFPVAMEADGAVGGPCELAALVSGPSDAPLVVDVQSGPQAVARVLAAAPTR